MNTIFVLVLLLAGEPHYQSVLTFETLAECRATVAEVKKELKGTEDEKKVLDITCVEMVYSEQTIKDMPFHMEKPNAKGLV